MRRDRVVFMLVDLLLWLFFTIFLWLLFFGTLPMTQKLNNNACSYQVRLEVKAKGRATWVRPH